MLNRFFELHYEVQLFLETNFELYVISIDRNVVDDNTRYFTYQIFINRLNDLLNLSLQGKTINRFLMNDKIKAIIKKT